MSDRRIQCDVRAGSSRKAAKQMHEPTDAGGIEMVDLPGESDDIFGNRRLKPCRQTVAGLDQMLGFADRRRAPLAARAIAARFQHASTVEFDPQQHMSV